MLFCYLSYAFVLVIGLILMPYVCFELHYFMRMSFSIVMTRFKKKKHVLDEAKIQGICLTTDIDTLLFHMNNARYLRELDFARLDFFERTGLYRSIKNKGGGIVMGATTIRYRRYVKLFHRYIVTSKIIYWDEQNIYMEHRFISPSDKFVNAIVLNKTRVLDCNVEDLMNEILNSYTDVENQKKSKPDIPLDVAKWLESNAISSENLRTGC